MLGIPEKMGDALPGIPLFPPGDVPWAVQGHFPNRAGFSIFLEAHVDKTTLQALQITKEIVVKFVETGRISPANFNEHF